VKLRPYQQQLESDIYAAWGGGARHVVGVLPTGGGKTVTFANVIHAFDGPSCAIAHRQELVTQISVALAREGVKHQIIGPDSVVKQAINTHMAELGSNLIHPGARVAVAGVDTLPRRAGSMSRWMKSVGLWVQDEAHHLLRDNKWGKAAALFPNAKGLGVTATPTRADGKGLGSHADGLFDAMVEGPTMRELIDAGYLTDYRIFAPPSDFSMDGEEVGRSGDWSTQQMRRAAKKSHVVGDVVAHYLRIAPGKLGITFAPDVETAGDIAEQFRAAGVAASMVHGGTSDHERADALKRFARRELMQLVNVDLFGEGFDLPAVEVVSFARPTQSFSLYCQQFGRALRLLISPVLHGAWDIFTGAQRRGHIADSEKPYAVVIDHVGNVHRHGLPDAARTWTLDRREKRARSGPSDEIPTTSCIKCTAVYERVRSVCPYCGFKAEPMSRGGPEFVDGDLTELDPAALRELRGEIARISGPVRYPASLSGPARARLHKVHHERQQIQAALRESIAWWAGYQRSRGRADSESYRRFYFAFGVDVMTAQTLNGREALTLAEHINDYLGRVM